MPFAGYDDFDDCVEKNSDKDDPKAYCATIMQEAESSMRNGSGATTIKTEDEIRTDAAGEKAAPPLTAAAKAEIREAMSRLAVSLRRSGMPEAEAKAAALAFGAKCGLCDEGYVDDWQPYGGAQTFAEADAWRAASDQQWQIDALMYEFDALVDNVWADDDMEIQQKASAVRGLAQELEAKINAVQGGDLMAAASLGKSNSSWLGKIRERFAAAPKAEPKKEIAISAAGPMAIFRDKSGKYRYIAIASNNFVDKEGECFPASAHEEFVDWANKTGNIPELWLWHVPGSRVGKGDVITYDKESGFRVTLGSFDPGMDDVAQRLAAKSGLAMSHGYMYDPADLVDGVYRHYQSFEESVLPSADVAANAATSFVALREEGKNTMLSDAQRPFFVEVVGEDRVAQLEETLGSVKDSLVEQGIAFKAVFSTSKAEGEGDGGGSGEPPKEGEGNGDGAGEGDGAPPATTSDEPNGEADGAGDGAGDDNGAGDGDGDEDQAQGGAAALKVLGDLLDAKLTPLAEQMKGVGDRIAAIEAELPALREQKEHALADMIRPRMIAPGTFTPPSADPKNVVRKNSKKQGELDQAIEEAMKGGDDEESNPHVSGLLRMIPALNGFRGPSAGE